MLEYICFLACSFPPNPPLLVISRQKNKWINTPARVCSTYRLTYKFGHTCIYINMHYIWQFRIYSYTQVPLVHYKWYPYQSVYVWHNLGLVIFRIATNMCIPWWWTHPRVVYMYIHKALPVLKLFPRKIGRAWPWTGLSRYESEFHPMHDDVIVTGHLCGEFTGPRWIPRTKASDSELWCFLWSASE